MKARLYLSLGAFFLLAGCGTVKINIDYGNTPIPSRTDPLGISTPTPPTLMTPTYTVTQTATETASPSPTESLSGVVAVAAGHSHTCAVTEDGSVKCWGANDHGQLGNGTMVNSNVPVEASGLAGVKAITAGWGHTCALTMGGGVKCWGYNANGELGNGTTTDRDVPVDVMGLSTGVAAIDAGDDHTCAVIAGNRLKCWGYNGYGQLGDETQSSRSVPIESPWFGGGVADVAAGWGHTCVQTTFGWAKCWGNNEYGQLGIGKLTDIHLPATDVVNLNGKVLKVSADGGQTCALTAGGGVSCWGANKYGQLGDGTGQARNEPVQTVGLIQGVRDVEMGWNHACAVLGGGELNCWGWNFYGQLGDGTKVTRSKPVQVLHLSDGVVSIALGFAHTCVATELGTVKCWGSNAFGQLGDGTESDSGTPLAVVGLSEATVPIATLPTAIVPTATIPAATLFPTRKAVAVTTGEFNSCALTEVGGVMCWGDNEYGQLGDGTTMDRAMPVDVLGLTNGVKAIAAGDTHTCALTSSGGVKCWGNNAVGQLGDGTQINRSTPVDVVGLASDVKAITAGMDHMCALTISGMVKCWGNNYYAKLGDGTQIERDTPVDVTALPKGVTAVAAGNDHNCVLTSKSGVKCWGRNDSGQVGDGTAIDSIMPVDVVGLSAGVAAIAVGGLYSCALLQNGMVKCWGDNQKGQFGDGTLDNGINLIPVNAVGLSSTVKAIIAGWGHTCVLFFSGGIQCWGWNSQGQLGDGTDIDRSGPVNVLGLSSGVKTLDAGYEHTCAVFVDGRVMCWGYNGYGQLGNGAKNEPGTTDSDSWIPVYVVGFGGPLPKIVEPTFTQTPA